MWDFVIPLVLMLIFYLVPEILKKKRRQAEYKYPEIPDQVPPPMETRAPARVPVPDIVRPPAADERSRPVVVASAFQQSEVHFADGNMSATAKVSSTMSEAGPWDGQLDHAAVVNGIIFAEIVQPPRCKRPMRSPFQRG